MRAQCFKDFRIVHNLVKAQNSKHGEPDKHNGPKGSAYHFGTKSLKNKKCQ